MLRVLILGGTGEAAALATQAIALADVEVMSSLAGRTQQPAALSGDVRIGGFGGVEGLIAFLRDRQIDCLIDATHPFAAQISWNAAAAATTVGIPHLMLVRPMWQPLSTDRWIAVESVEAAANALAGLAVRRVFLTVGRQQLAPFAHLTAQDEPIWFLMRLIELPAADAVVPQGEFLCDRGPFLLENERLLLTQYAIDAVISKNSGGPATYAKIIAARELGLPVVMVNRPPLPPGLQVADVDSAINWLTQQKSQLN